MYNDRRAEAQCKIGDVHRKVKKKCMKKDFLKNFLTRCTKEYLDKEGERERREGS
jgi:hypothetical protein